MSAEQWYVRKSGKITGPFNKTQLEGNRRRNLLAKFHEVSRDRMTWENVAVALPWLFESEAMGGSSSSGSAEVFAVASPTRPEPASQDWFYHDATGTPGPVSTQQIAALLKCGRIRDDTQIWREGFPSWLPLRDVPEFAPLLQSLAPPSLADPALDGAAGDRGRSHGDHRSSRWLIIGTTVACMIVVAALAVIFVVKYRKGEISTTMIPQSNHVNSYMSANIDQATGLVVSGADLTFLKSGEKKEVPAERGTCFAVSPDGYLITNRHVVEGYVNFSRAEATLEEMKTKLNCRCEPSLWVCFVKRKYPAKVVYTSGKHDLAVLKIERDGPYFQIAPKSRVVQGTRVYALGFPAASSQALSEEALMKTQQRKLKEKLEDNLQDSDFSYNITDGIISLLRNDDGTAMIQHSAQISGGNSGGPLIHEDGSVLGINTLYSYDKTTPGVGVKYYAVSLPELLDELKTNVPKMFAR